MAAWASPGAAPMLTSLVAPLSNFVRDEDGPTAVEYAVMLALVIVVCFTTIAVVGTNTNNTFSYVNKRVGSTGS
jgi:pilus assembly protein Flp/PilA